MAILNEELQAIVGEAGSLALRDDDEVTRKLFMIVEGCCDGLGPVAASAKYGYTRQRFAQLRQLFLDKGADGLRNEKRGPKTNYRRDRETVRQIIRLRFLDPDCSSEVIAQKLRQLGFKISSRSVERVINEFGLQKKTSRVRASGMSARG